MGLTAEKYCSFPIASITKADAGGDITVVGRCSDGQVDHDGDIVSPQWLGAEIKSWLASYPALRYQHRGDHPAGKGLDAWQDPDGSTWLTALVCDSAAKAMVRKQVLRAFSIGVSEPQTRKSARAPRFEIVGGRLTEVSLVDAPSNARCGIEIIGKSAGGSPEYIGKAWSVAKAGKPGKFKVNKAHQALYDDPEAFQRWIAKQAQANHQKAFRAQLQTGLNSSDPWQREMARKVLGRYGLG